MADELCTMQLIDATGEFDLTGLESFVRAAGLADRGLSYAVVSIMGPQSSGKSTLLNHLFRTNFREMNALEGRTQTTKGIWIAKPVDIEPCTIVMDLEGTDGRERGQDDTAFEKQSALFALAVSDIVLINLWCHDIGREHAANRPLLKTVFQVMMRLFSPRKTTLLFVIRDKTKTPLKHLEPILREDIEKIWDIVPKPDAHKHTPLGDFFNVEVTALPSYEEKEEEFKEQVAQLRQRFFHSISPGGLAADRRGVIPASAFSFSAQQIWKVIRENKDLDLPAHKVMVATVRCEEIANEIFTCLTSSKSWLELKEAVQSGPVTGFGKKLDLIIDDCFSRYDMETIFFDEGVRRAKRQQLKSKVLKLVHPSFQSMLGHLRSKALDQFKKDLDHSLKIGKGYAMSVRDCHQSCMQEFDHGCLDVGIKQIEWDTSKAREKLCREIEAHAVSVRSTKLSLLKADFENQLNEALAEPIESLFDAAGTDTWASIRNLYKRETEKFLSKLSKSLSGYELNQATFEEFATNLEAYARSVVEKKTREEAAKVLIHMKNRFATVFSHDTESIPRIWTGKEDIPMITKEARAAGLEILSVLSAIRLEEKPDYIEQILKSSLINDLPSKYRGIGMSGDPLASCTWEEVPPENTLIMPVQCKSIWRQFEKETEYTVLQAISAQEAHKRSNSQLPPPWAILAIAVLGFNEFKMLLRNPLYIMALFVISLLFKAIWVQLDITGDFHNGMFSGILALSSRYFPIVVNILRKLSSYEDTSHWASSPPRRHSSAQISRAQVQRQDPSSHSMVSNSSVSSSSISTDSDLE